MVCPWKREFSVVSDHNFFFIVHLSYSRFIFTHHLQPIIKEVDSDVEVGVDPDAMAIKVYDPPPSREAALFVPHNSTTGLPPPPPLDPLLLPYHMVPQCLPFSDLLFLPYCARLPTLFVGKSISVIDNSPTTSPSTTSPLATPTSSPLPPSLSTMLTFLDYSLFSDGVPPPRPQIGNNVILLLFIYFVLPMLLL
ncbi:hypothetical protein JHK82_035234 [Glycine max]|nr:hypothetical protein JHK82_035234 [Glycine max]